MAAEVKITADNQQLITKLDQAIAKLGQFESKAKTSASAPSGMASSWAAGFSAIKGGIAAAGIGAAAVAAKRLMSAFDDIADNATRLGVSASAFQRISIQAQLSGSSAEALTQALVKMQAGLQGGDAEAEKMNAALQALGISAQQFIAASPDQQIAMLSAAFQKARAEGKGLSDIQDLFKRQFVALIPLLSQTAEEAARLAAIDVVSDADVKKLSRANDEIDLMWTKLKNLAATNLAPVAGTITELVEGFERSQAFYNPSNKGGAFQGTDTGSTFGPEEAPMQGPQASPGQIADAKRAQDEAKKAADEMQSAQDKLQDAQRKHIELTETAEAKVNRLLRERDTIEVQLSATQDGSLAKVKLQLQYQDKSNEIIEAQNAFQREQNSLLDDANDKLDKAAKLKQSQQAAKNALEDDIGIAGTDDPKLKARRQRMKAIKDDATRIMEQTGMGSEDAMKAAMQLNPAKDVDEGFKDTTRSGRKKIKGYSGAQRASNPFLDHRTFNEFFHNPQRDAAKAKAEANAKQKAEGSKNYFEIMKEQLDEIKKLTSY